MRNMDQITVDKRYILCILYCCVTEYGSFSSINIMMTSSWKLLFLGDLKSQNFLTYSTFFLSSQLLAATSIFSPC